jgi:hypothetical protein
MNPPERSATTDDPDGHLAPLRVVDGDQEITNDRQDYKGRTGSEMD